MLIISMHSKSLNFPFCITIILLSLGASITAANAYAQEALHHEESCNQEKQQVTFKPHTIFDESEEGIIFLHRWANAIHIDTKVLTLENEAAFFLDKCRKNHADLAELERHLRSKKYIRDAKVTGDEMMEKITITTWDNWSLLPTISFGRQGGESKYSFGIKERNFLGLGIDAELESYKNSQRSGYKVKTTIPLFSRQSIDLRLRFADNDDGKQKSLYLQKHFAAFHTKMAYNLGYDEESRNDTIFQNDIEQAIYRHKISFKTLDYAWLSFNDDKSLLRYHVGITQDYNKFSDTTESYNNFPEQILPQDRVFVYPWLGIDYLEKDFKKLTNIHLITQIEDFNHGWQFNGRLGLSDGSKEDSAWALFSAQINKGFELHSDALLLMNISVEGDIYQNSEQRFLLTLNNEYFYRFTKTWGLYLNNINILSHNQYLDQPVTMGGNAGLRGFPLQYQHGEHSVKLTSEIRYYPEINLFKLFDLAGAAFFDSGRAFGSSLIANVEDDWLYSVGIGARLYSPHSSGNHQVIHIDFAFPQTDNSDLDNFEIRVEAKQSF
mgnify:CR=1 FL=1